MTKFKYLRNVGNRFKTGQNKQRQWAQSGVINTQIFLCRPTHPWVKKHKITTSANYTDGIGTGYTSHNKELCLHGKRLKNYFKINQSNETCTDAVMKRTRGGGKKAVFFPPKRSYDLGTDVKRGEQVGFL